MVVRWGGYKRFVQLVALPKPRSKIGDGNNLKFKVFYCYHISSGSHFKENTYGKFKINDHAGSARGHGR